MYVLFICCCLFYLFFFFNDTATTEIYTLSLHDALPISFMGSILTVDQMPTMGSNPDRVQVRSYPGGHMFYSRADSQAADRKSTRLNSSHSQISYAVFCLKKKKNE